MTCMDQLERNCLLHITAIVRRIPDPKHTVEELIAVDVNLNHCRPSLSWLQHCLQRHQHPLPYLRQAFLLNRCPCRHPFHHFVGNHDDDGQLFSLVKVQLVLNELVEHYFLMVMILMVMMIWMNLLLLAYFKLNNY